MEEIRSLANPPRIRSIDIVRGLTILVMLFVNDLASVAAAPAWMKHISPSTADGYTFVDVVFPAFLFIVGLSLPIALERRLARASRGAVLRHLLVRTLGLLAMGVLMVNTENIARQGLIDARLWQLLLYAAAVLIWIAPVREGEGLTRWRRIAGIALLVLLALLYRSETGGTLRPHWWGILGLIGWAYLVTGSIYLLLRGKIQQTGWAPAMELTAPGGAAAGGAGADGTGAEGAPANNTAAPARPAAGETGQRISPLAAGMAAAVPLLYLLYAADAAGLLAFLGPVQRWIGVGSVLGSHAAVTASGALLGILLFAADKSHMQRIRITLIFAALLGSAGVLLHLLHGLHPMFIYNKNAATPPWCLVTSGWTALIFALCYWLADARGLVRGTRTLTAAGQNALFAFILGPIAYLLIGLLPPMAGGRNPYWAVGAVFASGFFRALLFALLGIWFTALLHRRGRYLRM